MKSFASLTSYVSLLFPSMMEMCVDATLLFEDTLLNLGKAEGSIDAGNMIKPALARGLQLVGATTRTRFSVSVILSLDS